MWVQCVFLCMCYSTLHSCCSVRRMVWYVILTYALHLSFPSRLHHDRLSFSAFNSTLAIKTPAREKWRWSTDCSVPCLTLSSPIQTTSSHPEIPTTTLNRNGHPVPVRLSSTSFLRTGNIASDELVSPLCCVIPAHSSTSEKFENQNPPVVYGIYDLHVRLKWHGWHLYYWY